MSGQYIVDTLGEKTRRERIKPVPTNSTSITMEPTGGNTQSDTVRVAATLELAKAILGRIVDSKDVTTISRELTAADKILMRTHKVTATRKFLELHSRLFKIVGRRVEKATPTAAMLAEENREGVKAIWSQSRFANKRLQEIRE